MSISITGDKSASIVGTRGTCGTSGGGFYEFSGADYPSLGPGGDLSVQGPTSGEKGVVKFQVDGVGGLSTDGSVVVSADRKHVVLDASTSGSSTFTVKGTISCG